MFRLPRHLSPSVFRPLLRQGSSGAGPAQWGDRWVNIVRSESNITTIDDPPTSPLPESHEVGEGHADFCNYVDKNSDVSSAQAITGLGAVLGFCYAVYLYSSNQAAKTPPKFTPREFPDMERDFPTWQGAKKWGKE